MIRRSFLTNTVIGTLMACGGGASPPPKLVTLVSIWGDSTHAGRGLETSPTVRINQQLVTGLCIDKSAPGWGVEALNAGWAAAMVSDPASVVVLRLGGVDALGTITPTAFSNELNKLISGALNTGRRVMLVGVVQIARWPEKQDPIGMTADVIVEIQRRAAEFDRIIRTTAERLGLTFVNIRSIPFGGAVDMLDAVHPGQDYSNRCADAIAAALRILIS